MQKWERKSSKKVEKISTWEWGIDKPWCETLDEPWVGLECVGEPVAVKSKKHEIDVKSNVKEISKKCKSEVQNVKNDYVVKNHDVKTKKKCQKRMSKLDKAGQGTKKIPELFRAKVKVQEMGMTDQNHQDMVDNEIPWGMGFGEIEILSEKVFQNDELLQDADYLDDPVVEIEKEVESTNRERYREKRKREGGEDDREIATK